MQRKYATMPIPTVTSNGKSRHDEASSDVRVEKVVVPQLEIKTVMLGIHGTSSLITHAWSEKAKEMMRGKHQKKASRGREVRNPQAEFESSLHVIDPSKPLYGFPAIAFKSAAVSAALQVEAKKTQVRIAFHVVNGVKSRHGDLCVPLEYDELVMREDPVRVGMGSTDLRYRGEFMGWRCHLAVRYNARAISLEQLVALFNAAGFGVGVGEWRPERDGMNGMFEVGDILDGIA